MSRVEIIQLMYLRPRRVGDTDRVAGPDECARDMNPATFGHSSSQIGQGDLLPKNVTWHCYPCRKPTCPQSCLALQVLLTAIFGTDALWDVDKKLNYVLVSDCWTCNGDTKICFHLL
ncbi:hypothetical protein ACOSP7_028047 [Xanthoceras sorbifolium]